MNRTRIGFYVALIFVAGAFTGAGVNSLWRAERTRPPVVPREAFAKHIFNRIKERLELTPEQVEKVEPVFIKGFAEVRAIQDRSLKEVDAAVKRNHAEIAKLITPEQREKLEQMDREREKFHERRGRRRGSGGGPRGSGGEPGQAKEIQEKPTNGPTNSQP